MLYEDTSKPVPGLAEIQTSTKPKEDKKESTIPHKDEVEILKEETKEDDLVKFTDSKEHEARGNGKLIIQKKNVSPI